MRSYGPKRGHKKNSSMQNKPVKTELERPIDQKREDLSAYEQRPEVAKSMWESVFNCNSKKTESKKAKFKWVY